MSKKQTREQSQNCLSEDQVKEILDRWLRKDGWETKIAWDRQHNGDIVAQKLGKKWIIEVKGCGKHDQHRRNNFLDALAEILQRMYNSRMKYSTVFPNVEPYPTLWANLPALAKKRTKISVLFVEKNGRVAELES